MSHLVVGIDVSQQSLDVALCPPQRPAVVLGTFPNSDTGFDQLSRALTEAARRYQTTDLHLVMEPTGGYEYPLACFAYRQRWRISLPNPRRVRDWARAAGFRAKTDRQDALALARYAASQPLPAWHPLPDEVAQLEALLQRQEDLAEMLRQERNRRHAWQARGVGSDAVTQSLAANIAYLEQQLAEIQQAIQQHLNHYPHLKQEAARLQTVPGIGPRICLFILVLLYRWHTLTEGRGSSKGLTAYLGLDPLPYESGRSLRKRRLISRQGHRQLRHKLYMGALGGVRGHNPLRTFYQRLVGRGKAKKLALVAAARKILVWAWAVFRTRTFFDPQRAMARSSVTCP